MTLVGCGHMARQRNMVFVQRHVINLSEKRENTFKKGILSAFILNMSIPMDRWAMILVRSFFSRQDASNDTHDDPNGPTLQFDPGHGQGHLLQWTYSCVG